MNKHSPFYVPGFLDALGGLVQRNRALWLWLGRVESQVLADHLAAVPIRSPIFVTGLARSGSTLLHEVIASHPGVATHRSKDYPMLFTPYWWRRATANMQPAAPRERPHRDGVMVTTESPDALEEMLWMAFFPRCHDPSVSNVLDADDRHPAFASFYRAHLRKLLLVEGAARYVAKANYHVARLGYLLQLFPDARFVIPVRDPVDHVGSLLRQHRWFSAGQRHHPRALAYMRRTGHFEFGLDRRPINLGDDAQVHRIQEAWASGDEVGGLALYWAMIHRYLWQRLEADSQLRAASICVRYEDICADPQRWLRDALTHCGLTDAWRIAGQEAAKVRGATPAGGGLSAEQAAVVREITATAARCWGYSQ